VIPARPEFLVTKAQPGHYIRPVVFDENIGAGHQLSNQFFCAVSPQIYADVAFARVLLVVIPRNIGDSTPP